MKLRCLLLLPLAAQGQAPPAGRPAASFIPAGYHELAEGRATGDLNGDGRPDLALAVGAKNEAQDTTAAGPPPRRLLVLLAAPDGGYRLAAESRTAVLCHGCGGAYGDPFAALHIQRGVLILDHYGGSGWRWGITSKFRRQPDGQLYLIGETNNYGRNGGDCPGLAGPSGENFRDENFLTGAFEVRRISEQCRLLEQRRGRHPVRPLRPLTSYAPALPGL